MLLFVWKDHEQSLGLVCKLLVKQTETHKLHGMGTWGPQSLTEPKKNYLNISEVFI